MAEETPEPRRDVPKAIILSLITVAAVVTYASLALILAIPDYGAVISGEVVDPVADTISFQLGSGITKPLFVLFIIGFTASLLAIQTNCSRVMWAFARADVLPASGMLKKLSPGARLPVNTVLTTGVIAAILLISTQSENVYLTLISMATGGFYISFALPVVAALIVKLRGRWEPGAWNLGRCSMLVAVVASVWVVFEYFNIAWPRAEGVPWYQDWAVFVMTGDRRGARRGWPTSSCARRSWLPRIASRPIRVTSVRVRESPRRQRLNVLALSASPRRDGNSFRLAEAMVEGAREAGHQTELVHLDDHVRHHLRDCRRCRDDAGRCTIDDGFEALLRDRVLPADAIIFATPLYWYGVSGQLKTFLDRLFCFIAASEPEADMFVRRLTGKRLALVISSEETYPGAPLGVIHETPGVRALHALAARRRSSRASATRAGTCCSIPATRSGAPARSDAGWPSCAAPTTASTPSGRTRPGRARRGCRRSGAAGRAAAGELERTQREPQLHDVARSRGGRGR